MNENQHERAATISGKPGDLGWAELDETPRWARGWAGRQEAHPEEGGAQAGGQGGRRPARSRAGPTQAEPLWEAPLEAWACDDQ